jgi:hypothetical protein
MHAWPVGIANMPPAVRRTAGVVETKLSLIKAINYTPAVTHWLYDPQDGLADSCTLAAAVWL